ncbi:enoyl-CoA hydratase-related protein [Streptomyces sp. NPDC051218]|uniref:enoyl-CoA hydratase-related protein n=1 Tax=Streptomyces sp. NPDC051218 TaxID=3365645 RepID=UPI0037A6F6A3
MTDAPSLVRHDQHDRISVVTLNRPPANALGMPLIDGLHAALDAFEASDARVLVLRSTLPGFFAAGADIKHMRELDTAGFEAYGTALRAPIERLAALPRPSIAVVEGLALGGGLELALAATLRVASPEARFGLPEPKLGLIAAAGGTQRLPRLIGAGRALDLMLTAREIGAQEALDFGLVNRLAERAVAAAMDLATVIASRSPAALTAVLRCVDDADELPMRKGLAREAARENELFDRHDGQEGIRAFVEKRTPRFA